VVAPATVTVHITSMREEATPLSFTRYFETEMVGLEVQAPGVRIRESPTLPSPGRTSIRTSMLGPGVQPEIDQLLRYLG